MVAAIWFFLFKPRMLYAATILAIPFTATAVVNFGWANAVSEGDRSIAAWRFFCTLWICREAISGVPPWHRAGWFSTRRARYGLFAFLAAALVSLCVPLVLEGTTLILQPKPVAQGAEMIPLRLSSFDVTQTAYLTFGILFAVFVAAENSNSGKLFRTLKLYVGSCTFAAAWGLFELWCEITGHPYPAAVFNTGTNISATGYKDTVLVGNMNELGRISSVAQEPSVLASTLLFALVALVVCLGLRRPILQGKWDFFALFLIATTLLASTSSTAYLGISIVLPVAAVALSRAGQPIKRYLMLTGVLLATGVLVAQAVPLFRSVLSTLVLHKYQTASGAGRLDSVVLAAGDFLRYPLLGLGWHNVDSADLLFLVLANTGLVGLIAFASFVFPVLRGLWALAKKRKPAAVVLLAAFVLTVILSEATGPAFVAGIVWLVFGLGAGALTAARTEAALEGRAGVRSTDRLRGADASWT